jgi:hypothetical protein
MGVTTKMQWLAAPAISDRMDVSRLLDADGGPHTQSQVDNLLSYSAQKAMLLHVLIVVLVTMGR